MTAGRMYVHSNLLSKTLFTQDCSQYRLLDGPGQSETGCGLLEMSNEMILFVQFFKIGI